MMIRENGSRGARRSRVEVLEPRTMLAADVAAGATAAGVAHYTNPLEVKIADPAILEPSAGASRYLLSGTGLARYASDDLVNWERRADWTDLSGTPYSNVWASEAVEARLPREGLRYFYYFSAEKSGTGTGNRVIGVAKSDSPDGAFTVVGEVPLNPGESWIDPHVLVAGKRAYLYVTKDRPTNPDGASRIYAARLGRDMVTLAAQPSMVLEVSQPWESGWIEGASVVRQGKFYYLAYSSNCYCDDGYSVGVATSRKPTGPFTKDAANPVLRQPIGGDPARLGHSGSGHNDFVRSPDGRELFLAYHTHITSAQGGPRQLNLDRVTFASTGRRKDPPRLTILTGTAPTDLPQPYPSGAPPTPTTQADEFDGDALRRSLWRNVWGEEPGAWRVEGGELVVTLRPEQVFAEQSGGTNVFLQQAPAGDWEISTRVTFDPQRNFEHAFLTAWEDSNNYVMLKHVFAGGPQFEASVEVNEAYESSLVPNDVGTTAFLMIRKRGNEYTQLVSGDGEAWTQVGPPVTLDLQDVKVGLGAWSAGGDRPGVTARFDYFDFA